MGSNTDHYKVIQLWTGL